MQYYIIALCKIFVAFCKIVNNMYVSFDGLVDPFINNICNSTKGKIRYSIVEGDLDWLLDRIINSTNRKLNIIDVGGGFGYFASKLAAKNHTVTLLEVSQDMINKAVEYAKHQGTINNQLFITADIFNLPNNIKNNKYDLVLCHAVLDWVEKKQELISILSNFMNNNSYLSLLFYNKTALLYQSLIVGNFSYIESDFKSKHRQKMTPKFPQDPKDIDNLLKFENLSIIRKTGIRIFHDYMRHKNDQTEKFNQILSYEKKYCRDETFYKLGRYLHYICFKDKNDL